MSKFRLLVGLVRLWVMVGFTWVGMVRNLLGLGLSCWRGLILGCIFLLMFWVAGGSRGKCLG